MSNISLRILSEAVKLAPIHGFSNTTYACALKNLDLNSNSLSELWPRGFPVALAEYVVKLSTNAVQQELEAKYGKNALVSNVVSNVDSFIEDQLVFPRACDVVENALLTKIHFMSPFVGKWHEGVKCELKPSNLPYTIINLAEFADVTSFYVERVNNLGKVLESARSMLAYKKKSNGLEENSSGEVKKFLETFLKGVPLSSGPHIGGLLGQANWSLMRGKIATLYCISMASLMGDRSVHFSETNSLVKQSSRKIF